MDHFRISDKATNVNVKVDKEGHNASAFETIDGTEQEIIPISNVFDESFIDKESKLDKAVKISEIIKNLGQFISGILGAAI